MQLYQYRIDYKWREADRGQTYRIWRKAYQIVKAVSADDAERTFARSWDNDGEFEIVATERVGVL